MSKTLTVELGRRAYPISIGTNLLGNPEYFRDFIGARQVVIVTNETVAPLYLDTLRQGLADFALSEVILPDGETFKTLDSWRQILDTMLREHCARDTTLVALGGGVIGDIAGFAAACYQRGIALIQVPTTLLAQVDSSVGGKTAVNHPDGKNMIGAFHQPVAVVADLSTFETLPQRELSAGLAEVLKYGFIRDPDFLNWLESHMAELLARDPDALAHAVYRSCEMKAAIVAEDELENGPRALLNLGHTFGHAIETASGYDTYLHGEAVAIGACMAAELSARLGWLETAEVERVCHLFSCAGLPTKIGESLETEELLRLMAVDKKVLDGQLRLVLLQGLGHAVVHSGIDPDSLRQAIDARRQ